MQTVEEDNDLDLELVWDDVSGGALAPNAAGSVHQEEFEYSREMRLYDKVSIRDCRGEAGQSAITDRWVDVSQGDVEIPGSNSRVVAIEVNTRNRDVFFAVFPWLQSPNMISSTTASANTGKLIIAKGTNRLFFHSKADGVCVCAFIW